MFGWLAGVLVLAVTAAWIVGLWEAVRASEKPQVAGPTPGRAVGSALTDPRQRPLPYLSDSNLEFLDALRGRSGKLRAAFRQPGEQVVDEPAEEATAHYEPEASGEAVTSSDFKAPDQPGVYKLAVELGKAQRAIDDVRIITMVPFDEKKEGRIGLYYLGRWPFEGGGRPPSASYGNPAGFVEVTRENRGLQVSEHFRLGDFLTKDQPNVWPKYMLLDPRLLDKLELVIDELKKEGRDVRHVTVMSGFRTPRYNTGGGNTQGRANLSRHMFGDGADVFVDNDRDGGTDDLDGNGKVDVRDAEVFARAAERVEARHPALVGGIGIYVACCGHGPFTHIDVRGRRARWRGEGPG